MADFFQFELDFVDALRCIPMSVRYKLDSCGIKLKLHQWNQFTLADREQLVTTVVIDDVTMQAYRSLLRNLIQSRCGEVATELPIDPQPPWSIDGVIPEAVAARSVGAGLALSIGQWQQLSFLQRFALIKLSQSSHEQNNFAPALQEFGLL
jgi:hypothetical protein